MRGSWWPVLPGHFRSGAKRMLKTWDSIFFSMFVSFIGAVKFCELCYLLVPYFLNHLKTTWLINITHQLWQCNSFLSWPKDAVMCGKARPTHQGNGVIAPDLWPVSGGQWPERHAVVWPVLPEVRFSGNSSVHIYIIICIYIKTGFETCNCLSKQSVGSLKLIHIHFWN